MINYKIVYANEDFAKDFMKGAEDELKGHNFLVRFLSRMIFPIKRVGNTVTYRLLNDPENVAEQDYIINWGKELGVIISVEKF